MPVKISNLNGMCSFCLGRKAQTLFIWLFQRRETIDCLSRMRNSLLQFPLTGKTIFLAAHGTPCCSALPRLLLWMVVLHGITPGLLPEGHIAFWVPVLAGRQQSRPCHAVKFPILMVGLGDPKGLFQPEGFCEPVTLNSRGDDSWTS